MVLLLWDHGNTASIPCPEYMVKELKVHPMGTEMQREMGEARSQAHFKGVPCVSQRFFRGLELTECECIYTCMHMAYIIRFG